MSSPDDHDLPALGLPDPDTDPMYARLRAAIGATGAGPGPRPGWEAAVWAAIDADGLAVSPAGSRPGVSDGLVASGPSARRWGLFASGAAAAAAAAILLVWAPWRDRPGTGPTADLVAVATPTISIRQGAEVMRGSSAAPGDAVEVRHAIAGGGVWIFEGDTLRLACDAEHPGDGVCRRDGQGVFATFRFDRLGTFHVVTAQGGTVSGRLETLDDVLARFTREGVRFRRSEIDVR